MSNCILKELIIKFIMGDMKQFHLIYEVFEKLITHYAFKLGGDDAKQELNIFLIELLYGMDIDLFEPDESDGLQRYISVCIRNKYIKISRENANYANSLAQLYENQVLYTNNLDEHIDIEEALALLPDKQRLIVIYRYIYNYSDDEIAARLGVSRQSVHKLRCKALAVLKQFYKVL